MVTELLIGLLVAAVIVIALLVVEVYGLPHRRRRAIVNLRGDAESIDGILWSLRGPWLLLKDARVIRPDGSQIVIDGEVCIDKAQVSFIQVL